MTRVDMMAILIAVALAAIAMLLAANLLRAKDDLASISECPNSVVMVRLPDGGEIICAPAKMVAPK